jgi:hypothetical protein
MKAQAAGNLTFYPGDISNVYFEGSSPVFEVGILVQNTSANSLTLQSFAANVLSKQIDKMIIVGNLSGFNPVTIPGNSEGAILVRLRLSTIGLVNDIVRAYQTGSFKQDLIISGGVNVAGIPSVRVPINLTYKIGA